MNASDQNPRLERGLGRPQAIALNVANMVGIGPLITIPTFIAAMHLTMNLSIIAVVPWEQAMESQQIAALFMETLFGRHVLRTTRPDVVMPFRMWLYPAPSLLALTGWLFVLGTRTDMLWAVFAVIASGMTVFFFVIAKPVRSR